MSTPEKIQIRTPDGTADAWVHRPPSAGIAPAVILYPDAGGVRPVMHEMATRAARLGYVVLLPNVLYRAGDFAPFDMKTVFADPAERARIMTILKQLDPAGAARDAGAYLDAIAGLSGVEPGGKVGCVGYCLGGRLAFSTGVHYPDRVAAVASIHGGHLVSPDPESLHLKVAGAKARFYLGVADNDGSCPPEHQAALVTALASAHLDYAVELYAGKAHGFAVPDHGVYDAGAAELHWTRIASLFETALLRSARDTLVA